MLILLQQTLIFKGVSWISIRPKNDVEQSKYKVNEKNDNIKKRRASRNQMCKLTKANLEFLLLTCCLIFQGITVLIY